MPETCIIFATAGRPEIICQTLDSLERQSVKPASVIISCTRKADVDASTFTGNMEIVLGEKGLTKQRNNALKRVSENVSYVAFFDDDFLPHPKWIETVEDTFRRYPDIVVITGNPIADGINGPGFTFQEAEALIQDFDNSGTDWIKEPYSPYGCNMAFRKSAIKNVWFDERLVLYAWQEDRDYGARVARRGRAVQVGAALGVHLGVKSGRVSGLRLGYSQVANPIYLYKKGTMALWTASEHILRNFCSNLVRSLAAEAYVDRSGRLRGNFIALLDLLRGRASPERAETL